MTKKISTEQEYSTDTEQPTPVGVADQETGGNVADEPTSNPHAPSGGYPVPANLTSIQQEVLNRGRSGEPIASIATDMHNRGMVGWGRENVRRFLREHLGARRARRSSMRMQAAAVVEQGSESEVPVASLDAIPVDVPPDASLEQIEWWLSLVRRHVETAEQACNVAAIASLSARATALLEAKRKATPEPPPDPNANPDMIRLGEQVEARLFRLVDALLKD